MCFFLLWIHDCPPYFLVLLFSQWTDILYTPHIDHFVTQSLQVTAEQPFQESQRSMPSTLTVGTQPQGLKDWAGEAVYSTQAFNPSWQETLH